MFYHPLPQTERGTMTKILAISGSLRRSSSNKTLLNAVARLAPDGIKVALYDGIGQLPHFNPDLESAEPPSVTDFRAQIKNCDGLLISSPEYAHGVPGVLKNALDWLVGGSEIVGKPIALLNASPRSTHAQEALLETLKTMSTKLVPEAFVAVLLLGKNMTEEEIVADPEMAGQLSNALEAFAIAIQVHKAQIDG
jgi:chromate reductase